MLSPAQLDARRGKLTASRVSALMTGDAAAILRLYMEMIGEVPEVDLSDVWAVRLGEATEQLNLDWFERKNRVAVMRRGDVVVSPEHSWAACTLDGITDEYAVEAKHCGGREPLETVIERYQPQLQFIMLCTETRRIAIAVIMGASEPIVEFIERDDEYIKEIIHRGAQFMDCVARRIVPVHLAPIPPPVDVSKYYDMLGNNQWANAAATWLSTKAAARDCADAEKYLKSIVPPDARKCTGYGVVITRDRAGRLSLREIT